MNSMNLKKFILPLGAVLLIVVVALSAKMIFDLRADNQDNNETVIEVGDEDLDFVDAELEEDALSSEIDPASLPFKPNENIESFNPLPGDLVLVGDSLLIFGQARGSWFFEASFPIKLVDGAGKELATGVAKTEEDWMTEEFIPFEAEINVPDVATATGTLFLVKDNPSGLPEHDDSLAIPLIFSN